MAPATKQKAAKQQAVTLQPLRMERVRLKIVGDSPMVMHAFGEKAQRQIAENQKGGPKDRTKPPRDPKAEYEAAFYRDPKGRPCIPAVCFKNCIVSAAMRYYAITKVFIRGAIRVLGDDIPLEYDRVEMNTSTVRLAGPSRPADLRYRPMFHGWWFEVEIEYDASAITQEQLFEYVRRAGFSIGLFEWRVEKGGEWGAFHIATSAESKKLRAKRGK